MSGVICIFVFFFLHQYDINWIQSQIIFLILTFTSQISNLRWWRFSHKVDQSLSRPHVTWPCVLCTFINIHQGKSSWTCRSMKFMFKYSWSKFDLSRSIAVTMSVKSKKCATCIYTHIHVKASHHDHAVWWNWCLNKVDPNPICSANMLWVNMSLYISHVPYAYIYIYIYIINLFWACNSIKLIQAQLSSIWSVSQQCCGYSCPQRVRHKPYVYIYICVCVTVTHQDIVVQWFVTFTSVCNIYWPYQVRPFVKLTGTPCVSGFR